MKTLPAFLIALMFGTALPAAAAAPTLITVTGQGHVSAVPDMATETFSIATNADSAAAATSDNNARYSRLLAALHGLGVADRDVRTTGFGVSYNPPPQPGPAQPVPPPEQRYGYFANRSVEVTLHRLALTGKAVDAAVAAGVTDVGGVTFGISNRQPSLQQALREAVADALVQARTMAAASGLRVVAVRSIGQQYPIVQPFAMQGAVMRAAAPAPPTEIEPSGIDVTASVTVTYEAR